MIIEMICLTTILGSAHEDSVISTMRPHQHRSLAAGINEVIDLGREIS